MPEREIWNKSSLKWGCQDMTKSCTDHDAMGTLILPLLPGEQQWYVAIRGIVYFLLLCYFFIGVAIASDIFMSAIEYIISKSKLIPFDIPGEGSKVSIKVEVRVWNPTVANLTLMALGSSAPEILLSIIETIASKFESKPGDLGPGTIVGSAAFNLLFISAVCVVYVPRGQVRRIEIYNVFLITTIFSLFAYIWIWIVLGPSSKNEVELWEALLTLFCFPILVCIAWWADNTFCLKPKKYHRKSLIDKATEIRLNLDPASDGATPMSIQSGQNPLYVNGQVNPAALLEFYKEVRENAEVTDEEAASLVAYKLVQTQQHSRLWYRMGACRALMGSAKIQPTLNEKLQEVYEIINDFNKKTGKPERLDRISIMTPSADILNKKAVFDFQAASYSVPENIGLLNLIITRSGMKDNEVVLKVMSIDGTAKAGMDFEKVDIKVVFEPFVTERTIGVKIIDDNQWEPDESFFLRLALVDPKKEDAMLGPTHTMEITIVDDDTPGQISLSRRGLLVSETSREVALEVLRKNGCDGIVAAKWCTVPDPTGGVKHPNGMTGKVTFQHGETSKLIHVPLFQENNVKEAETFDVELLSTEGGASLGTLIKTSITISDDAAFQDTVNKVVGMAAEEMDIVGGNTTTYRQQFKAAFQAGDGDEDPSVPDYIMHFISLPWKVFFAFTPPARYCGGWPCFVVSLAGIGLLTAFIGDIATIFGCIVNLEPAVTAITLVALGTSLPDTFASMAAASHDDTADNAIGNVTGSNSVNVFLGLGLPWTIATIYHLSLDGKAYHVDAGSLAFSVIVYSTVAVIAVVILIMRRFVPCFGKAELGGPVGPKWACGIILICLWMIYIVLSALEAYDIIKFQDEPNLCKNKITNKAFLTRNSAVATPKP